MCASDCVSLLLCLCESVTKKCEKFRRLALSPKYEIMAKCYTIIRPCEVHDPLVCAFASICA